MPTKDRQRALARAKLERQMAKRAEAARKRRQLQAAIGAGTALLLVVVGVGFLVAKYGGSDKDTETAASNSGGPKCSYLSTPASGGAKVKDVGKPAVQNIPNTGNRTATIVTNLGAITANLDQAGAPCTVNSFAYLASKGFFNKSSCHRLTTSGLYVLQCGDPFATGSGGPSYRFASENLPTNVHPPYPAGTLAMANSGQANTNGSQFFIVYKESGLQPDYTVFGKITKGLDIVTKVAAKGVVVAKGGPAGDGKPKQPVTLTKVTTTNAS